MTLEWISVALSVAAVALAIWSTRYNAASAREAAKLDTYARVHELLISADAALGRRQLFEAYAQGSLPRPGDATWDRINTSLALYDTVGQYAKLDLVPVPVVMASWYHPIEAIREPAEAMMQHRMELSITQPWAGLRHVLALAAAYSCACSACSADS